MKTSILIILVFIATNLFSQNVGEKGDSLVNYTDINGNKQGFWKKTYKNGRLAYTANFVNDKLIGEYKRFYSVTSKPMLEIIYDKEQSGMAKLFWDTGKLMAFGKYINKNIKDSVWNFYGIDEKLMATVIYDKGIKNGLANKKLANFSCIDTFYE